MQTVTRWLPCCLARSAGGVLRNGIGRTILVSVHNFYSVAAVEPTSTISSSQLILLNHLGSLPSVARHWDSRTVDSELRSVDAAGFAELELTRSEPTAVQRELAKKHGVVLPAGSSRTAAASTLATALPPSIRSLAVLYGVLEYDEDVPASDAAARQLISSKLRALPQPHPLDNDLSPVAHSQVAELFSRLGYVGRLPYSYGSAQLMAVCLRTILAEVDDEARLRPLPSLDARQVDLIRYLRSRRAPPGSTRGMPAVLDVDLSAQPPASRLAAARNILQLVQNHELCANPVGDTVDALRNLGHTGPVPPTTGEALMLARDLRDRCLSPTPAQLAALRAAGYVGPGVPGDGGGRAVAEPPLLSPDSVAHVKALLRVLRRADVDAATPATRTALRHLAELRRRTPAAQHAAAAAAPWISRGGGGAGAGGSAGRAVGAAGTVGPCPSLLEVRAAIEDLPLSDAMMERLFDLGWPGPMPTTHGSGLALEDYLLQQKTITASTSTASGPARYATSYTQPGGGPPHYGDPTTVAATLTGAASPAGQVRSVRPGQDSLYGRYQRPMPPFVARLGSSPEEALTKIQIRGMFPGALSEWYLPTMSYEEAQHALACLMAARRAVLERATATAYDEYVDRWSEAEAEGDWWGMEWLWH